VVRADSPLTAVTASRFARGPITVPLRPAVRPPPATFPGPGRASSGPYRSARSKNSSVRDQASLAASAL
jgi:hypothetical protein